MPSLIKTLLASTALLSAVSAQGVILGAKGDKGTSLPLQVQTNQADANIINDDEITSNVVNECGRTLLAGNIDVGANTEDQMANGTLTQVSKGGKLQITVAQLDANGAGPYTCDMDPQSNAAGVTGQIPLNATESDGGNGQILLTMTMPKDLACIGASTGNVCTVRCRNTAKDGPFGGCVAVQQSDVKANKNQAGTIATAQTLSGVQAQVQQNLKDLPTAVKANQDAKVESDQGVQAADLLLNTDSVAAATAGAASAAATSASNASAGKKGQAGKAGGNTAKAGGNTAKAGGNAAKAGGNAAKAGANAAAVGAGGNGKGNKNARAFMA